MTKKEKCELWKKELSEYHGLKPKQEIKLEDVFNDEKRQGVKELIDTHKQRPEKYSERFDNDKSEIGNPDTWGKRVVEEPKQETLEDIKLEEVLGSSYCKYTVIENKLATIYRNQEKILSAIKLLSNEK
jgi:tyrosine-protein phosphatase YwqE